MEQRDREFPFIKEGMGNEAATLKGSLTASHRTQLLFLEDPVISLLGIYPNELINYIHTKTCRQMFIAALIIIAKAWKRANVLQ